MTSDVMAPSRLALFSPNDQDVEPALPTPPYKPVASSSQLRLDDSSTAVDSPPYRQYPSSSRIVLGDAMDTSEHAMDSGVKKPVVHYPSDVEVYPTFHRSNSYDESPSKPPSLAGTDDEDHDEDYDWSTDEDLVDEEAKLDQKMLGEKPKKAWGPKRIATFFFSTLLGSTLLAGVIIAVPLLLHFYYYLPHRTDHRKYITDNVSAWLYWAAANLLLSWYLAMIVDIIPIVCNIVIGLTWGEVNEAVRSRIELYNAAKDKIKPLLYGASGWASWIVIFDGIYNLYERRDESLSRASYTPRTFQAIEMLFFLTLVLSAEKILSHLITFAFHRKAFNERIVSLKENLRVIDHLRNYRPKRQSARHSAHRPIFSFAGLGIVSPGQEKTGFNFGLGSATNGERQELLPHSTGSRMFTLDDRSDDGHVADTEIGAGSESHRSKKGKERKGWGFPTSLSGRTATSEGLPDAAPADQPYQPRSPHTYPPTSSTPELANSPRPWATQQPRPSEEEPAMVLQAAKVLKTAVLHDARNITGTQSEHTALGWSVNSAHEAKRLARSIYTAFKVDRHGNYLIPSDFYPAYTKHEDAEEAFKVFDQDNNGDISRAEIKTVVLKLYKERRALTRSLRDVGNALKTLDWIMIFFAMVILFFISLSVFHIGIGSSLTSFYTIGIAASFIFKNAASSAFDAVMFIFVTHPFDTGDRCFIDAENLVVKKMGLFATTFSRSDGTETYYFNSQLFTKFITNVRRSGKMFENVTMQVAWRTPLEKLDQLETSMNEWLATEENRWFDPTTAVTLQKIEYQRCLEFTMSVGHNGTWQDWGLRNARKTAFLSAVHYYCRQLGITFHESAQAVFIAEDLKEFAKVGMLLPESDFAAPTSPGVSGRSVGDAESDFGNEEARETVLGFKPPPQNRSTLKARKSKVHKGKLRGTGEGG